MTDTDYREGDDEAAEREQALSDFENEVSTPEAQAPAVLTEKELEAIRERVAKASKGPWVAGYPDWDCRLDHQHSSPHICDEDCNRLGCDWLDDLSVCELVIAGYEKHPCVSFLLPAGSVSNYRDIEVIKTCDEDVMTQEDAEFIAAARTDIPRLLATVDALKEQLALIYTPSYTPSELANALGGPSTRAHWCIVSGRKWYKEGR